MIPGLDVAGTGQRETQSCEKSFAEPVTSRLFILIKGNSLENKRMMTVLLLESLVFVRGDTIIIFTKGSNPLAEVT